MLSGKKYLLSLAAVLALSGCAGLGKIDHVEPLVGAPVTGNDTPYSSCLAALAALPGSNLPVIAVGDILDKTGQFSPETYTESTMLTQGVSEMVISAFYKTNKVKLTERLDVRVPVADQKFAELTGIGGVRLQPSLSDFVVLGALTELNYNILSGGARLFVNGIGAGQRTVIINVGVDLRLVESRTLDVLYVTSLQKQVIGFEIEAGIFSFFGSTLVEFDAGMLQNEPLQVGVRSVVEMAVFQILTEGLGLARDEQCSPGEVL